MEATRIFAITNVIGISIYKNICVGQLIIPPKSVVIKGIYILYRIFIGRNLE